MDFEKNEATGFYEYTQKITSSVCTVYVKQDPGKHIRLLWKDNEEDEAAEVALVIPYKGIYQEQLKSEVDTYYLTIECGSNPTAARITEH